MHTNSTIMEELFAFETRNLVIILTVFCSISTIIIIFILYRVVRLHIFEQRQKEPQELWQEYLIENKKDKNTKSDDLTNKPKKKKKKSNFNLSIIDKKLSATKKDIINESDNDSSMNPNSFADFMNDMPSSSINNNNTLDPSSSTAGNYIDDDNDNNFDFSHTENSQFEKNLRKKELKFVSAKFFKRAGFSLSESATTD